MFKETKTLFTLHYKASYTLNFSSYMKIKIASSYLIQLIIATIISSFQTTSVQAQSSKGWEVGFNNIGIHSSPRAVDLNSDGVKDLIIGCSKKEFQQNDTAVMAVDGATGKILWKAAARDQMYGSAALLE